MRIVFMGTSDFAVPSLKKLVEEGYDIAGVVTQPDRPKGRGNKIIPPPVKEIALLNDLPVYQPENIKKIEAVEYIKSWEPELIVVVSYGQILPKTLLELPPLGCINVHASLLPFYRGAAPIQRAIMDGRKETGVTTMFMEEGLDTGDIIMQLKVPIEENITHGELEAILAWKGADLLIKTIKSLKSEKIKRQKQDGSKATYAAMLTYADEIIDWNKPASAIHNQVRALSPKPGAYTTIGKNKIKIFKSRIAEKDTEGKPGTILTVNKDSFIVQTGKGSLEILELQREGKKRMPASEFIKGNRIIEGLVLGRQENFDEN
ncbi:methionyl-tRNA formyltransferase [Thermosyntropha sp.]|uniref:methionyl-tRNA formyltransferase n=1 Tax=Thermosyntropha sp. TaxID=2740820 RepID=UPI0025E7B17B|nr:methionyl-tRNA formyltransferase [Thermosyntropha sp.]MBO8158518.1 methionyl-tRNA formyltransferase [Thermosyntropha sp.]